MPPATAASKSRSCPASSAAAKSSVPTLASSSLLAVTTGLPWRSAVRISSRAGSMPPITSTTTSMSGSSTSAWLSRVSRPGGEVDVALAGQVADRHPGHLEAQAGAGLDRPCACRSISWTSAAPTLPQPSTPTRTTWARTAAYRPRSRRARRIAPSARPPSAVAVDRSRQPSASAGRAGPLVGLDGGDAGGRSGRGRGPRPPGGRRPVGPAGRRRPWRSSSAALRSHPPEPTSTSSSRPGWRFGGQRHHDEVAPSTPITIAGRSLPCAGSSS